MESQCFAITEKNNRCKNSIAFSRSRVCGPHEKKLRQGRPLRIKCLGYRYGSSWTHSSICDGRAHCSSLDQLNSDWVAYETLCPKHQEENMKYVNDCARLRNNKKKYGFFDHDYNGQNTKIWIWNPPVMPQEDGAGAGCESDDIVDQVKRILDQQTDGIDPYLVSSAKFMVQHNMDPIKTYIDNKSVQIAKLPHELNYL